MPARSTPFQKLVVHIQSQLAKGSTVVESAMRTSVLTGESREVDVLITTQAGEYTLHIGVECIEHKRPASVTWVEQQHTKHQQLGTNKLVLVSLAGFSKQARTLAEKLNIECYTPAEAQKLDWTVLVGSEQLFFARYDFTTAAWAINLASPDGVIRKDAGPKTVLVVGAEGGRTTLGEVVTYQLHRREFGSTAMSQIGDREKVSVDFVLTLVDPTYAVDDAGNLHLVHSVPVKVTVVRTMAPVKLQSLDWNGTPVAFGNGETPLGKTIVTVVETAPGVTSTRVVADGREMEMYDRRDYDQTEAKG